MAAQRHTGFTKQFIGPNCSKGTHTVGIMIVTPIVKKIIRTWGICCDCTILNQKFVRLYHLCASHLSSVSFKHSSSALWVIVFLVLDSHDRSTLNWTSFNSSKSYQTVAKGNANPSPERVFNLLDKSMYAYSMHIDQSQPLTLLEIPYWAKKIPTLKQKLKKTQ